MAVVKLGSFSEGIGDDVVGDFQFFQHGELMWHKNLGLGVDSIGGRGDQLEGQSHLFWADGGGESLGGGDPGAASQEVEQTRHALGGAGQ